MTQTSSFELLKEENDTTNHPQAAVSSTPLPEEVVGGDFSNPQPTMQHERKHWSNTLKVMYILVFVFILVRLFLN